MIVTGRRFRSLSEGDSDWNRYEGRITESTGITKYAEIEPFEDVSSVTTVQVVTSFLGQGSRLEDYLSDGSSAE